MPGLTKGKVFEFGFMLNLVKTLMQDMRASLGRFMGAMEFFVGLNCQAFGLKENETEVIMANLRPVLEHFYTYLQQEKIETVDNHCLELITTMVGCHPLFQAIIHFLDQLDKELQIHEIEKSDPEI